MAITPILRPVKPPRIYPNMNAELGIRCKFGVGEGLVGIPIGRAVPIGVVPANAMIVGVEHGVSTPFLPATLTINVGTESDFSSLILDGDLTTPGVFISPGSRPGYGYSANERRIFASFGGTGGAPTAGLGNILVAFYANID